MAAVRAAALPRVTLGSFAALRTTRVFGLLASSLIASSIAQRFGGLIVREFGCAMDSSCPA